MTKLMTRDVGLRPSRSGLYFAAMALAWFGGLMGAHAQDLIPMPYYSAVQTVRGLYAHELPPRAEAFAQESRRLVSLTKDYCDRNAVVNATDLHAQWLATLERWQAFSTPAVGAVVTRRSQRTIDFWPSRDKLILRALKRAPQTMEDMRLVGTPAKGFGGYERLLAPAPLGARDWPTQPLTGKACRFLSLVAQGILDESEVLQAEVKRVAAKDWGEASEEEVARGFAEWVNQWLGGLERLRWAYIGKPLAQAATARELDPKAALELPRLGWADNVRDWRAQWGSLSAMAVLSDAQRRSPPTGDEGVPPIEALVLGKGDIELAAQWHLAVDRVDALMGQLDPGHPATEAELGDLVDAMQSVSHLYQERIAAALDVPLGFSDADGD